jgi:hypothetical protein
MNRTTPTRNDNAGLSSALIAASSGGNNMNNTTNTTNALPKLTCLVTGKNRNSNIKYLEAKALRLGVSVDVVINNYVSRDALKLLRKGQSFEQVQQTVGIAEGFVATNLTATKIDELLRLNAKGKHS